MSDNKNFDEEYQYVEEPDIEPIDVEPETTQEKTETKTTESDDYVDKFTSLIQQSTIKRNAILAVLGLFFLLGLLKCVSKPSILQESNTAKPIIQNTAPAQMSQSATDNQIQELMNMQKSMQANLASMNDKMNQLNSQLSVLNSNNQALQQQLSELMSKYQALQQSINEAMAAAKARPQITSHHQASMPHHRSPPVIKEHYFVQAIIPGRAWLVSNEGRTVTVRVGTLLPGYGRVAKIDAQQGRVEMSSSKVFVFSQSD
jgi:intracellular multiplication protein IcmG